MKVSFHRRRHDSLPPTPRRSPRLLVVAIVLGTAGVAVAAANLGDDGAPAENAGVSVAEQGTRDVVDERIRAHLRRLR